MYNHYAVEATKWIVGPMPIDEFLGTFLPKLDTHRKTTRSRSTSDSVKAFESVPVQGYDAHRSLVRSELFWL